MKGKGVSSAHTASPTHAHDRFWLALCGSMGLLFVASLLAWAFRLGRFDLWFLFVGIPALVVLFTVGFWVAHTGRHPGVRTALIAGVAGGLVGTIGYDLFRVPFVMFGLRLFAPIESYGVLLLGAESSSPWTHLAGWAYHFSNGLGFGVFYACLALGRKWWWGLGWAMVLETATVVTPFATTYALKGKWGLIAIAYAAHVFYGVPLGKITESGRAFADSLVAVTSRPITWILASLLISLIIWHRPWSAPTEFREGRQVASGPSAVVKGGKLAPDWLRVSPGSCASIKNLDTVSYDVGGASGSPRLVPGKITKVCFQRAGVMRVRLSDKPYSGGFVIVDPALA